MKIQITTEREIVKEDFFNYIKELKKGGIKINELRFLLTGKHIIKDNLEYTKSTTTYRILQYED